MKFGEKLFQIKLLSRLSHKVCRLLSSPVLLRKFTIVLADDKVKVLFNSDVKKKSFYFFRHVWLKESSRRQNFL